MLPYKRSERVKKLLHHKICDILKEIKDPRLGFVTVTDVELSDDLQELKVFYSVLGDEDEKKKTQTALENAIKFIRFRVGEEVDLRVVPHIKFVFDKTVERAQKVFSLLDQISKEKEDDKQKGD